MRAFELKLIWNLLFDFIKYTIEKQIKNKDKSELEGNQIGLQKQNLGTKYLVNLHMSC